jgi:GNAT superfamily N-acetyltransferase
MYTLKAYRRKGIAKKLLEKVIKEAKEYRCGAIQITASNMGVLLYTDYGFEKNNNFMQLEIQ